MRPLALAAVLFAAPVLAQQQPALRQVTPNPGAAAAVSPAAAQNEAQQRTAAALRAAVPSQVNIGPISARDAVQWISTVSDLPIVVNWDKLAIEGIDAAQQVQLTGVNLTAEGAIRQLMQQIAIENNLIMEVSPWFVEIMTKAQADQNAVIIVYPIGDLMMTIPNFTEAPEFDLSAITQSGGGGRGGGGGSGTLFQETQEEEIVETELERGGRIADLIRQSVEPDLWRENGGLYGSITYFNKHLIVRAPMYVHRQIGGEGIRAGSAGRISPGPGSPTYSGAVTPAPGTVTGVSSYVNVTGQLDVARVQSLRRVPVFTPLPRSQQIPPSSRRGSNVGVTPTITRVR